MMAVHIGKLCINGINSTKELKKYGIYFLEKELDEMINNKIPLDYEFLLLDGSKGGIFVQALKLLLNQSTWKDSNELWEVISKDLNNSQKIMQDENIVFNWMSRIIERLPSRIIILDEKVDMTKSKHFALESQNNEIAAWIERRVTWIRSIEKVHISIDDGIGNCKCLINLENPENFEPREIILSIYYSWLKKFSDGKAFFVDLNFIGRHSQEISIDNIKKNNIDILIKYKFLELKINIKDDDILIPFLCPKNCLKSNERDDWRNNFEKFTNDNKEKFINLSIVRENLSIEDFASLVYINICKENNISWENCIDTLYSCFSKNKTQKNVPYLLKRGECEEINKSFLLKNVIGGGELKYKYSRHLTLEPEKIKDDKKDNKEYFYQESLSGSASHFNMLYSIFTEGNHLDKSEMYFNLVENGLTRIIIADERLAKYTSMNPFMQDVFKCAGIIVLKGLKGLLDKDLVFFECNDLKDFEAIKNNAQKKLYDIFIVHQGILDKSRLKLEEIEKFIDDWKKMYFSFVAVTSGRGTPVNIPRNARFFPFSILESNLLTPSISKLTVVKTLFKSLARSF